jgi:hypothetical protein
MLHRFSAWSQEEVCRESSYQLENYQDKKTYRRIICSGFYTEQMILVLWSLIVSKGSKKEKVFRY